MAAAGLGAAAASAVHLLVARVGLGNIRWVLVQLIINKVRASS